MRPLSSPLHHFPSGLGPRPIVAQDAPVQTMSLLGMFGCQGHVVEHTEPTGSSPLAVVPRRSAGGKRTHQGCPVPSRGHPQGRQPRKRTALTSPGQARCARLLSAQHPPAAAQLPRPAGHSGRCSVGAGVPMSPTHHTTGSAQACAQLQVPAAAAGRECKACTRS